MKKTFHLFFTIAAFFLFSPSLDAGEGKPVELGRHGKSMHWLEEFADIPYEVVPASSLPLLSGIPMQTEFYEIDPEVVASGYNYFFYVRSVDGEFLVGSFVKLAKLCRELNVIEELKKINKGKEFASGVGGVFKSIGGGLGNLILYPGQSMKSMGSSFRSMGRSVERTVGADPKVGADERGVNRSHLGEGPAGDTRRALAYQFGIDVYTDNPVLQDILVELSQVKELGSLASWVVPYGLGVLEYFNPMGGDQETELLIRDNNPYDLRRNVGMRLEPLFGISREDLDAPLGKLLYNPNYTPRQIAYIGADLEQMSSARGLDVILRRLAEVATPEEADLMALQVRYYSFLHRRVAPIGQFIPFRHFFASIGTDGVFRVMFAADVVKPWDYTADAFDDFIRAAMAVKARGAEVWTTADVDPSLIENARQRGVTVVENILHNPQFFPEPEQTGAKSAVPPAAP